MTRRTFAVGVIVATLIGAGGMALAQPRPSEPDGHLKAGAGHIEGYRSAQFGMTGDEVRGAITKDFSVEPSAIQTLPNPAEGTTALVVQLPELPPGPGPVTITYILGATSHRLIRANVIWFAASPAPDRRREFAAAGVALADYFTSAPNRPLNSGPGGQLGPNAVLLYVAADDHGAALEVAAEGIAFQVTDTKTKVTKNSAEPAGPALLRVSYIADALHPDVKRLMPGAF